jgi:hypothetical protein
MDTENLLTTRELADVTGCPLNTIRALRTAGALRPVMHGAQGRGHADFWSLAMACAIASGRGLRNAGYSIDVAGAVTDFLLGLTDAQLREAFADGRTHMAICGLSVLPKLIPANGILDGTVDYRIGDALAITPVALNVAEIYRRVVDLYRELRESAASITAAKAVAAKA